MENEAGTYLWDEPSDRGGDVPWQDTIDLLRLVRRGHLVNAAQRDLKGHLVSKARRVKLVPAPPV
jgi:hypothetical protein